MDINNLIRKIDELYKIDGKYNWLGNYRRRKREWVKELEGLYTDISDNSYVGSAGDVYLVYNSEDYYFIVSSCSYKRGKYFWRRHFKLNEEGIKKIVIPIVEEYEQFLQKESDKKNGF